MIHCLLLKLHVMIGSDIHDELTATLPPVPAPKIPHVVGFVMCGPGGLAGAGGATMSGDDVKANSWNIIIRGSDIQWGIPHIPIPPYPPCALLVLIIPLSGSRSYFGAATVQTAKGPVACCLIATWNLQLNCDDPLPLPLGYAISWSNVVAGMTWGDMALGYILNKIGSGIGGKILGKLGGNALAKGWQEAIKATINAVFQQITGSPIGYTYSIPGHIFGSDPSSSWGSAGNVGSNTGYLIGDAVTGPSAAPRSGPAPTPLSAPAPSTMNAPPNNITHDPGVEQH